MGPPDSRSFTVMRSMQIKHFHFWSDENVYLCPHGSATQVCVCTVADGVRASFVDGE